LRLQFLVIKDLRDIAESYNLAGLCLKDQRLFFDFKQQKPLITVVVQPLSLKQAAICSLFWVRKNVPQADRLLCCKHFKIRVAFLCDQNVEILMLFKFENFCIQFHIQVSTPLVKFERGRVAVLHFAVFVNDEIRVFLIAQKADKLRLLSADHVVCDRLSDHVLLHVPGVS